jgi:hypothetical protein
VTGLSWFRQNSRTLTALLGLLVLAEAWFVAVPHLGDLGGGEAALFVTAAPGILLAFGLVAACVAWRDDVAAQLALIALGGIAGAALSSAAPEAAAPFKALFAAGAGLALARLIPLGSIVYLLAIVVAFADAASVSVGPTHYLVNEKPGVVDYLALSIPSWGGGIAQLGVSDLLFCAVYLSTAWASDCGARRRRSRWRRRWSARSRSRSGATSRFRRCRCCRSR